MKWLVDNQRFAAIGRWCNSASLAGTSSACSPTSTAAIAATLKQHGDLKILIEGHTDATGTGAARALLDQQQLDAALPEGDDAGEAVLYGRISGTIVVRRVP